MASRESATGPRSVWRRPAVLSGSPNTPREIPAINDQRSFIARKGARTTYIFPVQRGVKKLRVGRGVNGEGFASTSQ